MLPEKICCGWDDRISISGHRSQSDLKFFTDENSCVDLMNISTAGAGMFDARTEDAHDSKTSELV